MGGHDKEEEKERERNEGASCRTVTKGGFFRTCASMASRVKAFHFFMAAKSELLKSLFRICAKEICFDTICTISNMYLGSTHGCY